MSQISMGKALGLAIAAAAVSSFVTYAILKKEPVATPAAVAVEVKQEATPAPASVVETSYKIDVEAAMAERALGQADAPVTVIEYASMTCDHCASFHNGALPEIKKQLIETGKVRMVYRDMPWDSWALKAAKMARCAPKERYFEINEKIFGTHDGWAHLPEDSREEALMKIGREFGMEDGYMKECFKNEALDKAMLEQVQTGRNEFKVDRTPFFIYMKDGVRQDPLPEFQQLVDTLSKHEH